MAQFKLVEQISTISTKKFQGKHTQLWGVITEVDGSIYPSWEPNKVYINEYGANHAVLKAWSGDINPVAGLPVQLGPDPNPPYLKIIGIYNGINPNISDDDRNAFSVPKHGVNHAWLSDTEKGNDAVPVYMSAVQPFKPFIVDATTIGIIRGVFNQSSRIVQFPGQNVDISSYIPVTLGYKVQISLYLNRLTNSIGVNVGTEVPEASPYVLAMDYDNNHQELCLAGLHAGQTEINTTEFIDGRDFFTIRKNSPVYWVIVTVEVNYTMTYNENMVIVDMTNAEDDVTIVLVAAAGARNYRLVVKTIGESIYNTLVYSTDLIDGVDTQILPVANNHIMVTSDGGSWYIISDDRYPENTLLWGGTWSSGNAGEITPVNTMMRDGGWLMVANNNTYDRPAPQYVSELSWVLPTSPPFSATSTSQPQYGTGNKYTILKNQAVSSFRIYTAVISGDYRYSIRIERNSTVIQEYGAIFTSTLVGWVELDIGRRVLLEGDVVYVEVITISTTAPTTFVGDWQHINGDGVPASGESYQDNDASIVRFSTTDNDAVDRSASLATVKVGDFITTGDSSWTVIGIDVPSYYEFTVTPTNRLDSEVTEFTFNIIPSDTIEFVYNTDYWLSNQPDDMSVEGFTRVSEVRTINDTAYGTDMLTQSIISSSDWDIAS